MGDLILSWGIPRDFPEEIGDYPGEIDVGRRRLEAILGRLKNNLR
jgi:hypothetical protein